MSDQQFEKELIELINKHSRENKSNTPDFILAQYLTNCLKAFEWASIDREKWYNKTLNINQS